MLTIFPENILKNTDIILVFFVDPSTLLVIWLWLVIKEIKIRKEIGTKKPDSVMSRYSKNFFTSIVCFFYFGWENMNYIQSRPWIDVQ